MAGWLGSIGNWLGLGGGASEPPAYQGITLSRPPSFIADQIRSDLLNYPYRGPGDLDRDGGETAEQRSQYRAVYQREGVVTAAIDGKVEGIAAERVTIEPFDRGDAKSRDEAEFFNWSVKQGEGWEQIAEDVLRPAFIDGWSVLEVTLKSARHPRHGEVWALRHCRSLDTRFLRLQMDPFRNITGVVSLVRGLESFSPDKVLIYTHRRMFHNHFGISDMRPVFRDAKLIEDAYLLWYLALKLYGEPYMIGTMKRTEVRAQFEQLLAAIKAGGWGAIQEGDKIELLSLATAVNFQAFEAKVKNLRENIFLSTRGSYTPFMEGAGGADSHNDTEVSEGKSDNKETLIGKKLCRLYSQQLAPILLVPNFGPDVVHRLPTVTLGGTDWKAKKEIMGALADARDKFPGVLSISQKFVGESLGFPPSLGPGDEANPGQQSPPDGPARGSGPGKDQPPPPSPTPMPVGSATDGPAALPTARTASPTTGFSAADASDYARHYRADPHGRYPGTIHDDYGLTQAAFARLTGLMRQQVGRGANQRWLWAPSPEVTPDKTFSADTPDVPKGTPGAAELAVAMMQAYAAGDDDALDALRGLADDPDGLAEFVADVEAGTHGTPGRAAFAATVRTFAAGTKTFGWVADPTPRSKTRATNTESGTHAYGKRAAALLAAQGRADRGEPEPEKPQAKAQRLKQEREPARADARTAWQKATTDPASLTPDELGALADHLHTLTRDEVREQVKQIRGGGHGGKLKAELVDALHQHARELVEHERGKEGVLADAMRQHLAANPKATDAEVLGRFGGGRPEVAKRVLAEVRGAVSPSRGQEPAAEPVAAEQPPAPAPESRPRAKSPTLPALDLASAADTHESVDGKQHRKRADAEAVPGAVAVAKGPKGWMALRETSGPTSPPPPPATPGHGSVTSLDDAGFAAAVQRAADETRKSFGGGGSASPGGQKVFLGDVYDALHASDPSLTRQEFERRIAAANASGAIDLSRADLIQLMHPHDVQRSEVRHPIGEGSWHFIRVDDRPRESVRGNVPVGDLIGRPVTGDPELAPRAVASSSPAPATAAKPPRSPKPSSRTASDPSHAALAEAHAAAPDEAKPYLEAAAHNAYPAGHDLTNPPTSLTPEQTRRLRKELAAAHADMHAGGKATPEADAAFGRVMAGLGVSPLHEAGETKPFDPETMQSDSGVGTGAPVRVVHSGWHGFRGDGSEPTRHESNYRRAKVEPAGGERTFADAVAAPTHAGLCVRAADTGRVLLLQRAATPDDSAAGKWEFPGGAIEQGETPAAGACREWEEEVGEPLPEGDPIGTWQSSDGVYAGHVLTVPTESDVPAGRGAGDRGELVAWREPGDLDSDDVRPELVASLPAVLKALGKWQNTREFASGPPRPGLVAQTGDNDHPGHWVRPEKAGGGGESQDSGPVASEPSPDAGSGPPPDQTRAAATAAIQTADPKAEPGVVARLADKAVTAAAKAHIALTRLTPAMLKAIDVVTAVADTPADMVGKFGFNPTFTSGGVGPRVADPVQDATGMSAHLAATLVGKVVGDGLVWVKNKTGVKLYADEPDAITGAAAVLREAFAAVAEEFGLSEPPGAEEIAEHMRAAGDAGRQPAATE